MSRRTCFLVSFVLVVFPLQAQRAKDVRIVPGVATHMGQVASDHVVLHSVSIVPDEFGFRRVSSDGLGDASAFVVPADQVLVVTDVSARNINGPAGVGILIQLSIDDLAHPPVYESIFQLSGGGDGGTSDGMTSGFIVAPGLEIFALQTFLPPLTPLGETTIILRGYLAPDE